MEQLDLDWVRKITGYVFPPETIFDVRHPETADPECSQAEIVVLSHGSELTITLSKDNENRWAARLTPEETLENTMGIQLAPGVEPAQMALQLLKDWFEKGWRDYVKAKPLAAAHYEQWHHQILAERIWENMVRELMECIPEELQAFAEEKGWFPLEPDGWWTLPEELSHMIENTRRGGCNDFSVKFRDLENYGFENLEQATELILLLNQAWAGIVEVKVEQTGEHDIKVRLYAVDFIPEDNDKD